MIGCAQFVIIIISLEIIPFWWNSFVTQVISPPILEEVMKLSFIIAFLKIWPLYDIAITTIGITIGIGFSLRYSLLISLDPRIVLSNIGIMIMHFFSGGLHGLGLYAKGRRKQYWMIFNMLAVLARIWYNLYILSH